MIELKNITKKYGEETVFDNFSVSFPSQKTSCVLGASGIGKTTLLNIMAGLTDFGGEYISPEKVSYVFQTPRLIENLTVTENLLFGLSGTDIRKENAILKINEMLLSAEIYDKRNSFARDLSGGQKQRVSLVRAFLYPSSLILMDEPFSSLDLHLKVRLIDLFEGFLSASPRTVILVTHDIDEALLTGDMLYVLSKNNITLTAEIKAKDRHLSSPELVEARQKIFDALKK